MPSPLRAPVVRRAAARDAAAIARVHHEGWEVGYRGIVPDDVLASRPLELRETEWRDLLDADEAPRHRTLVAELDRNVVAIAAYEPARDTDLDPALDGEVKIFYVDPARWRRGIGRVLMRATLDDLRADGFARAVLWVLAENVPARRFYEALGWTPDGIEGAWEGVATVRYRTAL